MIWNRLRSAIEDELEQLYDAYYDELEEYAHRLKDQKPTLSVLDTSANHRAMRSEEGKGGHAEDIDQESHDSHGSHDSSADEEEDIGDDVDGPGSGVNARAQLLPYDAPNIAQATGKANGSEPCRACLFLFVLFEEMNLISKMLI